MKKQEDLDLDKALGLAIKRLRQHQKLTQTALANKARVSQASVSMTENAKRNQRPMLENMRRIAKSLGLPGLGELILYAEKFLEPENAIRATDEFVKKTKQIY